MNTFNSPGSISHSIAFKISCLILFTIFFTYVISVVELATHTRLQLLNIPIAFLLSNITLFIFKQRDKLIISNLLFLVLCTTLFYLLSKTYDVSWDGQWYHQDAIIQLAKGWNPFYASSNPNLSISESDLWIHHYPQASWIVQANIFQLGGSIQATKLLHLILSMACFGMAYVVLSELLSINAFASLLFSVCIAFNPITYSQFFSFYVDGQTAMGLSIYILLLIYLSNKPSRIYYLLLSAVFIYIANIKFTNVVYLSVFNLFFYGLINYKQKFEVVKRNTLFFIALYLVGIVCIGYSSYTRNTLENGNPFYPLLGKNNVGEIVKNIPLSANFKNQNRFENFIDASFAYPEYARDPDSSRFRMPFTAVSYDEYYRTDVELSGFGARWSEILIISLFAFFLVLYNLTKQKKYILLLIPICICLSAFINEQFFVARYVPQLWLIPIFIVVLLYTQKGLILKSIALAISLFLIYNSVKIVEAQIKYQKTVRNNINLEIEYLKTFKYPLEVKCKYKSVINRLEENKIPYIELTEESQKQKVQFNHTFEENYYIQQ